MSSRPSSDIDIFSIVFQSFKYVYITLLIVGLIGNGLNILVLTGLKVFRRNQSALYLNVESMINIAALIYIFIERTSQYSDGHDLADYSLFWCKLNIALDQLFQLTSFSIICFAAFDQILSTSHWYTLRQTSTFKLAQRLILISTCLSTIHSFVPMIWFNIVPPIGCLPTNTNVVKYYLHFYYPFLVGVLPIFFSSFFSLLAFRNVRRLVRRQIPVVRRRLDRQLTAMILTRVMIFVISHLPYIVYRIFTIVKLAGPNYDIPFLFDQLMQTSVLLLKNFNYAVRVFLLVFLMVTFFFLRSPFTYSYSLQLDFVGKRSSFWEKNAFDN